MDIYKPENTRKNSVKRPSAFGKNKQAKGAVIVRSKEKSQDKVIGAKQLFSTVFSKVHVLHAFLNKRTVFILLMLSLTYVGFYVMDSLRSDMPIQTVSVQGEFRQLDKGLIEKTLSPLVGSNYFYVDIRSIKQRLQDYPWVHTAEVRKVWPDRIDVHVYENKAIAMWGDNALVNEFGEVFRPESINWEYLVNLPDLRGHDNQSDYVLQTYSRLSELCADHNMRLVHFELVGNRYWHLRFMKGYELFLSKGQELSDLETFFLVYEKSLKNDMRHLAKVDMRYRNGFSVLFSEDSIKNTSKPVTSANTNVGKSHG